MNTKEQKLLLEKVDTVISQMPVYNPTTDYNIFQVLGVEAKEVIMCRFLSDLLNPNGAHNKGSIFLKSFLEIVIGMRNLSDQLLHNTCVIREYVIDGDRRIDIVIENYQFFIPIEVKIYAEDQESQCFDYFKYARNARIVYLTRFATEPSDYSRKGLSLDNIKCIGWEKDIIPWLSSMRTIVDNRTANIIGEYMDAIHSVADGRECKIMDQTIEIINGTEDSFSAALEIEKTMKTAKLQLIQEVFKEIELQMKPLCSKYGLKKETDAEYYVYEEKRQERFYDCHSTYPGLNYVVEKADKYNDSIQLWFRIEVEHNLFAGFTLFDFSSTPKDGNKKGYEVQNITSEMYTFFEKYLSQEIFIPDSSNWWLTFCYPNGIIEEGNYKDIPNFKEMNNCAISLINTEKRKKYIQDALVVFEQCLLNKLK